MEMEFRRGNDESDTAAVEIVGNGGGGVRR